jgi:two-component system chemotaxis response regulator CheY
VKHCLIVDDSRVIRKVACRILEQLRFEVEEVEDGEAALDSCRSRMPDAILLDVPQPGNVEFLRNLRREEDGARPVVVLCMTENDVSRIAEAISAGANDFVMKPFDRDILQDKFSQIGLI